MPACSAYAPIGDQPYGAASAAAAQQRTREIACNPSVPGWPATRQAVPAEIDVDEFPSIVSVLQTSLEKFRDRPAFANLGKVAHLRRRRPAQPQFAAYLLGELKLKKGDRVAIMMPNCLQYPIAMFGVLRAGPDRGQHQPDVHAARAQAPAGRFRRHRDRRARQLRRTPCRRCSPTPRCKHVITTGLGDLLGFPKGAIVNFVLQATSRRWCRTTTARRRALPRCAHARRRAASCRRSRSIRRTSPSCSTPAARPAWPRARCSPIATSSRTCSRPRRGSAPTCKYGEEIIITALPLYHIFALTANGLVFMKFGGLNFLITNPRDMPGFVKELKKVPFTAITGVNTLFNGLLNTPGFDTIDFSHLHLTLGGGMAVQRAVAERWKKITGVHPGRGLRPDRNLAGGVHQSDGPGRVQRLDRPAGPVHRCLPEGRRRQRCCPSGEVGELCIQGPQVMQRLLAAPRRDRQRHRRRRLAAHRRHGEDGREGLLLHRRPQEGHDPGVRLQRVPERGRGRHRDAARRARSRARSACRTRSPARRSRWSSSARTRPSPPRTSRPTPART